ncbi:hypothetical protein ACOMHN_063455 [Nucella lapillus]
MGPGSVLARGSLQPQSGHAPLPSWSSSALVSSAHGQSPVSSAHGHHRRWCRRPMARVRGNMSVSDDEWGGVLYGAVSSMTPSQRKHVSLLQAFVTLGL